MLGSGFSMGVLVMGLSVGLLMVFFRWVFGLGSRLGSSGGSWGGSSECIWFWC